MSMYGANSQDKATSLLNQLDAASTDLIIPHIPQNDWSYAAAKQAFLYEFGSIARVTEQKNEFLMIQFQKDKSIAEFADQFYLEAKVLTGSRSLTVHDAHIALRSAVKSYKALYCTLMPAFQDNCSINGMCGDTFGPPNASVKPRPLPTPPACTEGSGRFAPKDNMSKVTCHCWKRPSGVETVLSHSTIDNPTNVPTILPDCLLQAPEGPVARPYGADHSPDKAELFVPDVGYSGNALHHVIVEDVHVVQTHSQAKAKGKAQAVVSKPYVCQLLEKAPNEGPGPSTDTSHLKGVNVTIPMNTMRAHHPKLCDSILNFLSMADDLDINLVKN
ncbi:hypothetical protein DSO57_1003079 [Entomophthora muscae]|uniref:Uncharacterized protein n=1 Tax=Entomophthora muscae TaxID=34485 RepID=A0ACC2UHY8_9FUNG|nr:hypothetical protein DSO57_1003079 [Entomophthora muscae]